MTGGKKKKGVVARWVTQQVRIVEGKWGPAEATKERFGTKEKTRKLRSSEVPRWGGRGFRCAEEDKIAKGKGGHIQKEL